MTTNQKTPIKEKYTSRVLPYTSPIEQPKVDAKPFAPTGSGQMPASQTQSAAASQTDIPTQPAAATKSGWQMKLDDTMDKILNREKFTYDLNGDALYNQYKDRFVNQGKMAMMDTMGQAAALTGGYGNSYAQTAGQQAYQQHLLGLNDKIPDLYNLALQKYNSDTDALYAQADLLGQAEQKEYNRKQDAYDNLRALIGATGMIPTAEQLGAAGMTPEEANALRMEYAKGDPKGAVRRGLITEDEYKQLTGKSYKSGGSGGSDYTGDDKGDYELTEEQLRQLAYAVSNERTEEGKAEVVSDAVAKGYISPEAGEEMLKQSLSHGKR